MLRRLFGSRTRHRYDVGIDHFNAGRMEEAIEAFDAALRDATDEGDPDVTLARFYRAEAHGRLGREALSRQEARDALAHFDAAIADHPAYPDLHLQRALCQLELEDHLAAERAALRALELNAELVEAAVALVVSLHEQGQSARAKEIAAEWKARAARKGSPLGDLLDDPSTALARLRTIRGARQNHRRQTERVEGLLHEGVWAKAEEILDQLLAETPDYPDLRLRMGACRAAQGDLDGALAHLDVALERNPDFRDGRVLAGIVELRRSHLVAAREHFEHARRLGSQSSPLLYGAALCALRMGRLEQAAAELEEIWRAERPGHEARSLRAVLFALRGRDTEAKDAFEEILEVSDAPTPRLDAAAWALHTGRHDLARRALDAMPPGPPEPATILARAEILRSEGDRDRAVDVLEAATADHPDHPGILWLLAQLHAERDHVVVALRRLANLQALGSDVFGATALAGHLLREQGDHEAALDRLQEDGGAEIAPETGLETLYTLRVLGEADAAQRLWDRWAPLTMLDLRWRVQDPHRWLGPIPVWPTRRSESPS